jgi:Mg-chelatase subunit ChlD
MMLHRAPVLAACLLALLLIAVLGLPPAPPANSIASVPLSAEPTPLPEAYALVDTWDTQLPTGRMLFHPHGIAVDRGGNVVVTEMGSHRLTLASSRGEKPRTLQPNQPPDRLGGPGDGEGRFAAPEDVAVTTNGDLIYVADTGNRRVQIIRPSGVVVDEWLDVGEPRGIAVGPGRAVDGSTADGRVYVADGVGRRVRVFHADGTRLADWTAGDTLMEPLGLTVTPSGELAVADHGAQRIVWLATDSDTRTGSSEGDVLGTLRLDNVTGPGGAPRDVGVNSDGEVFVAVSRGVLRFGPSATAIPTDLSPGQGVAAGLVYRGLLPPMQNVPCGGTCPTIGPPCSLVVAEKGNHEGVRRLDLRPGVGLYVTYSPSLRWLDRVVVYPAERPSGRIPGPQADLAWVWPQPCRDFRSAEYRHATDPERIAAGSGSFYAVANDTAGWLRQWRADGGWHDGLHEMQALRGLDIAVNREPEPEVALLTGNQLAIFAPDCILSGFPPGQCRRPELNLLDRAQLMRRDRTNDCRLAEPIPWRDGWAPCVPDDGWWHVATALGPLAAGLDAGKRRVIARTYKTTPFGQLAAGVSLGAAAGRFRSFADLAYDSAGALWVLARDGAVRIFDDRGRDRGEMTLVGPADGRASSLAVADDGTFFVLTGDGRVVKYAPDPGPPATETPPPVLSPGPTPRPTRTLSRPTATPRPTLPARALPLAEWTVADQAGPGRYRDLTVGRDGRVIVTDGEHDRVLVFAPASTPPPPTEPPPASAGPCNFAPAKSASPSRILLGDTTEVTLDLSGSCGSRHAALDVVVVMDASCQMAGERLARAREALVALIDALTLPDDRLAIVSFLDGQGDARLLAPLTSDRDVLRAVADDFTTECFPVDNCASLMRDFGHIRSFLWPYGCTAEGRISDGLRAGREALFGPAARSDAGKALILISPSLFDSPHILATLSLNSDTFDPPFSPAEQQRWNLDLQYAGDVRATVTDREHSMWEAWQLRDAGVRTLTTGIGIQVFGARHPPDEGLLSAIAWPADGYRPAADPADLVTVLAADGRELSARVLMHSLVITDRIPANMRLVPGSTSPPADVLPDAGRPDAVLRWTFQNVPLGGAPALRYRLEPLDPGFWPTNIDAWATYIDGLNSAGRSDFPVPVVEVVGPSPTVEPSSTPRPATETATDTSTPPPTPTPPPGQSPSATPTEEHRAPTATSDPRPLYLPFAQNWRCPAPRPVDIILVMDVSSSMTGDKLAAAKQAAAHFVALFDLRAGRDRAAVVSFDSEARVVQELTHSLADVAGGLAALAPTPGTRIDRGLSVAAAELTGPRRRLGADRAIVLLTDGRPVAGTETATIDEGALARSVGIDIWAIGLGQDADPALLAQITGSSEKVLLAPQPADLEAVYREVAGGIVCR